MSRLNKSAVLAIVLALFAQRAAAEKLPVVASFSILADLVKVSDDDLRGLCPGLGLDDIQIVGDRRIDQGRERRIIEPGPPLGQIILILRRADILIIGGGQPHRRGLWRSIVRADGAGRQAQRRPAYPCKAISHLFLALRHR